MLFDCCGRIPLFPDAKLFPHTVEEESCRGMADCPFMRHSFHHIHEARKIMGC